MDIPARALLPVAASAADDPNDCRPSGDLPPAASQDQDRATAAAEEAAALALNRLGETDAFRILNLIDVAGLQLTRQRLRDLCAHKELITRP